MEENVTAEEPDEVADMLSDAAEGLSEVADELATVAEELAEAVESPPEERKSGRRRRRRRRGRSRETAETTGDLQARDDLQAADTAPRQAFDEEVGEAPPEEFFEPEDREEGDGEISFASETESSDSRSEERRPRRRRRRGRRERSAREESTADRPREAFAEDESDESADLDLDDSLPAEEGFDDEDHGDEEGDSPRIGFRNIPTWDDAVGVLIAANMESRAKNPGSRSGNGNRGRGGNRGNRRRPDRKN